MIVSARFLSVCTLVLIGTALGFAAYAVLSMRLRPSSRLGLRGFKRAIALRNSGLFRRVDPLLRWAAPRLSPLLPARMARHLEQQIARGGELYGLVPEEVLALGLAAGGAGALLSLSYARTAGSAFLLTILAASFGFVFPYLHVTGSARARVRAIQRGLPQVVDLLILGLGAGLDFSSSLRQIVDHAGHHDQPVVEEIRLVLHELQLGHTRQEALRQLARRAPCEGIADLVAAAAQAEEQGTPLARVLEAQAASSRERRSSQAEEAASRAAAGLLFPMVLLFGSVMLLIGAPLFLELTSQMGR